MEETTYEVRLLFKTAEGNPAKWDWDALTGETMLDWHTIVVPDGTTLVTRNKETQ